MIDFRYHLVSIVAIFLSLAVGLVLGATALQKPLSDKLQDEAKTASRNNEELRKQVRELDAQLKYGDQFASKMAQQIVAARLRNESVVLVETPGANDSTLDRMTELADQAGASVTGRVTIQKKFLDDDQYQTVDELAAQLKPVGMTFAQDAGPYDKAGAVLASAIVTKEPGKALREDAAGGDILRSFQKAGYVTTSGKPGRHATLAIVIAPSSPYVYKGGDVDDKALISLAAAFDAADRGTVVGGPPTSAQDGGLIAALRNDGTRDSVSSVDTIETPSGQIVGILALQSEISGKSGQYGTGAGAGGALPNPAPLVAAGRAG